MLIFLENFSVELFLRSTHTHIIIYLLYIVRLIRVKRRISNVYYTNIFFSFFLKKKLFKTFLKLLYNCKFFYSYIFRSIKVKFKWITTFKKFSFFVLFKNNSNRWDN